MASRPPVGIGGKIPVAVLLLLEDPSTGFARLSRRARPVRLPIGRLVLWGALLMHQFLSLQVVGIVTGATYAVAASGLVVTYSTSGIFNIAHGAIGMFMAFFYWQLFVPWHVRPCGPALWCSSIARSSAALVERIFIRRVAGTSVATTLVVTIGFMVGLIGLVDTVWKPRRGCSRRSSATPATTSPGCSSPGTRSSPSGGRGDRHRPPTLLYRTRIGISMRGGGRQPLAGRLNGARPRGSAR